TGSQTSGDAYVAATLEALIQDLSLFPETGNDRIGVYKLFVNVFDRLEVDVSPMQSPFAWEKRAAHNLSMLPKKERLAFLLVSVEGFSASEASEILGVDEADFSRLIEEASRQISEQVATDIMIIE